MGKRIAGYLAGAAIVVFFAANVLGDCMGEPPLSQRCDDAYDSVPEGMAGRGSDNEDTWRRVFVRRCQEDPDLFLE